MTKRKTKKKSTKRKSNKPQFNFKLINLILFAIIILILILGYIIYSLDSKKYEKTKSEQIKKIEKIEKVTEQKLDYYIKDFEIKKDQFEEYTKDLYEEYVDKEHNKTNLDKEIEKKVDDTLKIKKEEEIKKVVEVEDEVKVTKTSKPKLSIIFDDVTTQYQINKIKDIGYITTISAMPPTKRHPNSATITKELPFYMIHLPLEATTFKNEEHDTLHIGDSYERIEKRISQIRKWYPNAKYTNNHTGSKFTEDYESMDKLFKALVKYDFIFVDSRTTGKSVAKQMAQKYNMPYVVRNIFLDNELKKDYIQNQLLKAVNIAKRNGFAIAIGHPHPETIKALKESKHLLKDVETIYLNQLPILN